MKSGIAFLLLSLISLPCSAATIYKYVDQDGHVTYSNIPVRGAKALNINVPAATGSQSTARTPARGSNINQTSGFPTVAPETQRQRDGGRRQILQSELSNEQSALDSARRSLSNSEASLRQGPRTTNEQNSRITALRETIKDRERNVQALQRELGLSQ
jgi:multidrug resistance efflux pump